MTLLSRAALTLALVAGSTFAGAFVVPEVACAGSGARAALVVDTGGSVHRYCVDLPSKTVSGTDIIVLAAEQHGLSYRLGYGGNAVCMLAGVGTAGDDCFERYPDFWGYWRGDGSGGWSWSGTGAGSTRVSDGDVEGWSWGSGSDGSSHPSPPNTPYSSVCPTAPSATPTQPKRKPRTEQPREQPREQGAGRDREPGSRAGSVEEPIAEPGAREARDRGSGSRERGSGSRATGRARRHEKSIRGSRPRRSPAAPGERDRTADLDDQQAAAAGAPPVEPRGGPPAAGVAALIAAGALGGVGTWLTRRRRTRS